MVLAEIALLVIIGAGCIANLMRAGRAVVNSDPSRLPVVSRCPRISG